MNSPRPVSPSSKITSSFWYDLSCNNSSSSRSSRAVSRLNKLNPLRFSILWSSADTRKKLKNDLITSSVCLSSVCFPGGIAASFRGMPTARDTPIRDSAHPHHQLNQPRQFHNDFSIDAEPAACALAGELQARIQSRNLIGRNLTPPPFFSLSSPKGGEGWGEEVNCF